MADMCQEYSLHVESDGQGFTAVCEPLGPKLSPAVYTGQASTALAAMIAALANSQLQDSIETEAGQ